MTQLVPYLQFSGNCREAMAFYKDCLGGELVLMPFGDSQMAGSVPADQQAHIMHSALTSNAITLMAADMLDTFTTGNMVSLCLVCSSKEEIERFFARLSQGGTVGHSLKEEFFGTFGDLVDKYGFSWMFQYDPNANA